jgi:small GTP-binding protein
MEDDTEDIKKIKEIKLLLLGESNVGKTSIFNKYIYNRNATLSASSIGVDFETKIINYKNKKYKIRLFDTAGQERFHSITHGYYHLGDGFLIVFDLTNEHSLNKVKDWIESLNDKVEDSKFIIIGNKCDLKDKLIPENIIENQIKDYIEDKKIFYKTSVLKNININKIFEIMIEYIENPESILVESKKKEEVKKVIEKDEKENEEISPLPIKKNKHNKNKENKCC